MNHYEDVVLDAEFEQKPNGKRRDLLPIWIKIFIWIFLIFGVFVPIGLISGVLGYSFSSSMYGLDSYYTFTPTGIILLGIFSLKAIVAYGLWTEKTEAVDYAIVDAMIGIFLCIAVMIMGVSYGNFIFRLELLFLIPYYLKMKAIKDDWMARERW
jgi:hypothetical protein